MGVETYFGLAFLVGLAVGVVLVIRDDRQEQVGRQSAPRGMPELRNGNGRVRMPTSGEQAMWSGYTCPTCKCELDKWGRRIARPA
jgi:hypothetical protein